MARPSKLTPEIQERVVQAIRAGNTRESTAEYARIGLATFSRWMKRGRKAKRGKHREFWCAVRQAEAECEMANVATLLKASRPGVVERRTTKNADGTETVTEILTSGDWRPAMAWLERRRPSKWGRKDHHKHEGNLKHEHAIHITEQQRAAIEQAIIAELGDQYLAPTPNDGHRNGFGPALGQSP
jgi:hypothetical protein